jgi:hypothetical protein
MTLYPCGTKVTTVMGGISGMITAVQIRFEMVNYEITYYDQANSVHLQIWQHEQEFTTEAEKRQIGFKNGRDK